MLGMSFDKSFNIAPTGNKKYRPTVMPVQLGKVVLNSPKNKFPSYMQTPEQEVSPNLTAMQVNEEFIHSKYKVSPKRKAKVVAEALSATS